MIAIDSGESFMSAASCFCANSLLDFFRLATISCRVSAEKQRSISGMSAGRVCSPASAWNRAMTASTFSSARGPDRSAAPSAACSSSIFALGTKACAIPAQTASAALRR